MHNHLSNKRINSPRNWVPSVYFGMGLPYVAISMVAPLFLMDLGLDKEQITYWTSLLVLPWSLKPIFSILMELFGTKRYYVICSEAITALMFGLLAATLLPQLGLPDKLWFTLVVALMGVMAVSGSVHDIAGDGIYMQELSTSEQGRWSGWQGAFYNLAKILTNGGLVYLAGLLSKSMGLATAWAVIMAICGGIMLALAAYHLLTLPKGNQSVNEEAELSKPADQTLHISPKGSAAKEQKSFAEAMQEMKVMLLSFIQKPYIWLYLIFIFAYRLAEGLAMKMAPLFLKDPVEMGGIGLSNEDYGLIYGSAGTIAFIVGSILSGYVIGHWGLKRVLRLLVFVFNATFSVYLLLAIYQPDSLWWVASGIIFEYFCYGFGFVGITIFMMQQIAPGKYQMAHYAFANSLMNLSCMLPGMVSGWLCKQLGYETFFLVALLCGLPAVIMSLFLPFAHQETKGNEPATA